MCHHFGTQFFALLGQHLVVVGDALRRQRGQIGRVNLLDFDINWDDMADSDFEDTSERVPTDENEDEYEDFINYELDLDLNDVASDTSKLVMLNAFYLKWLEDVITQRQKDRSIQFDIW